MMLKYCLATLVVIAVAGYYVHLYRCYKRAQFLEKVRRIRGWND